MEFVATFYGADRIGCSVNGNPTWKLRTSAGVYRTQSDADISYDVKNFLNTRLDSCLVGKEVRFKTTRAGRVWNMEEA